MYKLNGNVASGKLGLGITLKVMAGDVINVFGKSFYINQSGSAPAYNGLPILELLNGFLNTAGAAMAGSPHGPVTSTAINTPLGTASINSMISQQNSQNTADPQKPRAFINVLFFDEQFRSYQYRISGVGANGQLKDHYSELQNILAAKNGYVYIYCSNESSMDVLFDNVQVTHTRGALLEETHYYPFGLTMSGISSKALSFGDPRNKEKTFQGQRFDDELGLNWVQFKWRNHDPQIGRFIEIDPLANDYVYNSTYAFSENKVTNHIELEGLEAVSAGDPKQYLAEGFRQIGQAWGNLMDKINFFKGGEVHHNVEQKITAKAGAVESSATVTISENTASMKVGSFEELFKSEKNPIEFKAESNVLSKVEQKNAVTAVIRGVQLEASQKTEVDNNGVKNTISAGPKESVDVGKVKVEGSAQLFYSNQLSGTNAGQQTVGLKMAVDATFVSKQNIIIKTPQIEVKTTTQTKTGGSLLWNYQWPK